MANIFRFGYNSGMPPSEPKQTLPVTATQLESLSVELSQLAARLRAAAEVARAQPSESLAVYNWPSVPTGLRMLRNFVAKADESRSAAELGTPIQAGQLKSRSTAKTKSVEDVAAKIDSHRKKTKKKP